MGLHVAIRVDHSDFPIGGVILPIAFKEVSLLFPMLLAHATSVPIGVELAIVEAAIVHEPVVPV